MDLPEAAQELMGRLRQRHQAILVALGVTDVYAPACTIDVADLQPQPFPEAQSEAIEREEEHAVAEHACAGDDPLGLLDRDDAVG